MSRYEKRFKDICSPAFLKTVKKRKECIHLLNELCENKEATEELDANSKNVNRTESINLLNELCENKEATDELDGNSKNKNETGLTTWTEIIKSVHKLLLAELGRKTDYSQTMLKAIKKANGSKILVKYEDLVELVIEIISSRDYMKYHKSYLKILVGNILCTKRCQIDITSDHWRELFKHSVTFYGNTGKYGKCKQRCKKEDVLKDKVFILQAIYELLDHGCRQSHLSLYLGDIFSFLDKIFEDAKKHSRFLSEDVFKTANIICEKIAPENRMAVCEFGEKVIEGAIDLKRCSAKYDWMLLIIRAHHPGGVTKENEAAYAHDRNKWTKILLSIHLMILEDCKSDISWDSFVQLACEVSWQLKDENVSIDDNNPSEESDNGPSPKRRKIVNGMQSTIDTLTTNSAAAQSNEHKLSVQILIALVTKYPEFIERSNFRKIIKFLIYYLKPRNDVEVLAQLWELARVMIELDTKSPNSSVDNKTKTWDQIWNIALRSDGIKNDNEQLHKFLQSFIKYRKVIDSDGILNLYLNNTITWSKPSVQTLLIFCKHKVIPEYLERSTNDNRWQKSNYQKPVKFRLLQWALKIPQSKCDAQFPVEDTCELLLGLTLKSWHNVDQITNSDILRQYRSKQKPYFESDAKKLSVRKNLPCNLTNMEYIHLLTGFENDLYDETITDENLLHSDEVKVDNVLYVKENRDLLIQNLFKENSETKKSELPIYARVVRIAIDAKIISNLEQLNMGQENVKERLGAVVRNLSIEISTLIEDIAKNETNSEDELKSNYPILNTLDALCLLYKTRYRSDVVSIIQSFTELNMLKNILKLPTVKTEESEIDGAEAPTVHLASYEDRRLSNERGEVWSEENDNLSNESKMKIKSCTLLVLFCVMVNAEDRILDKSEDLQQTLLNTEIYDLRQKRDLKIATLVLESLIDCELVSFSDNVTIRLVNLLRELFYIWHKDVEAAKELLKILSKLVVRIHDRNEIQKQNLISWLKGFHDLVQKNETGSMIYITFIECLETIARNDPHFIWKKWNDSEKSETRVVDDILSYIKNPLYEVRFRAIRFLQTIFVSNNVKTECLKDVFSKLESIMNDLFVDTEGTRGNDDKRRNQIANALHMMAVIIYSNAVLRSKALLSIFKLHVDKNIDEKYVKIILERISVSLKIEGENSLVKIYLNYLLTHWLEERYYLNTFPFKLTGCTSEKEFYEKHNAVILPIVIRKEGLESARNLCDKYKIPFKEAIEKSLPHLISWLLPHISLDPEEPPPSITSIDIKHAHNVFDTLKKKENELEEIAVSVNGKLKSVILTIIKRLHDEQHSTQSLEIQVNYPCSDPPHFKHEDINRSFEYLENNFIETSDSLLYFLATVKQDVLQKVLHDLKCAIHKANYYEYKLKALHHYAYFSMMIVKEIKKDYFDEIAAFVVRDICHTFIHFVKDSSSSVSQAACSYLFHFLKGILPRRCKEIQHDFRLIMNSITSIVAAGRTGHACDIMELLVEHNDELEDAIGKLASFPEENVFDKVREVQSNSKSKTERSKSLENEIDHFLKTRDENTDNCSVTELQYLSNELSAKKEELKNMYEKLESVQRFSEDCTSSLLHQLICALVKLTASSDPDISITAAECLGELGPADLSTMILQPEKDHRKQFSDPMLIFTYRILILLSKFLTHSDIKLFTETSKALYTIMSSFWGQKISDEGQPEELKDETSQNLEDNTSQEFLRIEHIRPFVTKPTETNNTLTIDEIKFNDCTDENSEIWIGESNTSHRKWVTNITCKLLDCFSDSYLNQLIPVCEVNESFCEKILPWIIHLIIHTEKKFESRIYDSINRFFKFYFNDTNGSELEKYSPIESDEHKIKRFKSKSARCMLNVVDFIRSQTLGKCCLDFNYLDMAKAAQYCSAYFTSVLYAELWCESLLRTWQRIEGLSPIDYICDTEPEKGKILQEILKEAYIKIGDPDAIYGYGTLYFENPSAKIEHYAQCNRWDKVLLAYDIELSLGTEIATKGLLDTLQHSGLQYLLNASVSGINNREQDVDINHQFECAWRLSDWNMPLSQLPINSQDSFVRFQNPVINDYSLYRYQTLKSFHERDEGGFKTALKRARNNAVKTLRNISLESCKTVYPVLSQLQMLREIEEMYFTDPEEYDSIIEKWNIQDSIGVNDFQYIEPILSQRTVFLLNNDKRKFDENFLIDAYLRLAKSSQEHGYFQVTARALASLSKQNNLSPQTSEILQYQEAILASMNGNNDLGRRLLRNLIVKKSLNAEIHAQALTTYGNWMAESKSENPQIIIKEFYQASLECSRKIENSSEKSEKTMLDTRAALAQFADLQYQRLITHMKSRPFEGLTEWADHTEEAAEKLSKIPGVKKSEIQTLRTQSNTDKMKEEYIRTEKDKFLLLAVENYILTLKQGNDYDLLVFKLVSLWLANAEHEELIDLLGKHLEQLPSHKFIISVPQLAPHINESGNKFSQQISRLLERCALDHPYHTLPVLLSLMNSYKDEDYLGSKKSTPETRVPAAKTLIENLKNAKEEIFLIIQEMERLANSLIELANLKTDNKPGQFSIPKSQSIFRCENLERVLVPTLSIDVRPDATYDQIIGIRKYADSYDIIGGATVPKKITCFDTTGKKRYQLVKGEDDLRQDAVMQQVFTVMNTLLRTSKEAMKRKLRVRTYKVVPLSKGSGILEWCDNTIPIGKVLEGPKGLHAKYYEDDWATSKCEEEMKNKRECSKDERLEIYTDCCENLHPVFHYFFLENFPSPEIWFERRLSYTRSIATTSIIGYILGLGDRHLDNILIEKSSGEVIHIDFGIAFDQGKTKKDPETVPFRLSRDIEAAMGASGVESVLRRSCEETLTVLRQQRGVILTLLQVLLCDPISSWEIMPDEDNSRSRKVPGGNNKLAERAILQLEQKLQGIEEGSPYSVAGQVRKLIQEARDPVNLALSYYKQQPYL